MDIIIQTVTKWLKDLYAIILSLYAKLVPYWPFSDVIKLKYAIVIVAAILLILFIIIVVAISKNKKRKVKYFVNGELYFKEKVKYRKTLCLPVVEKEGFDFEGWYLDKKLIKKYKGKILNRKKNLKLYAKLKEVVKVEPETKVAEPIVEQVEKVEKVEVAPVVSAVEPTVIPVVAPVAEDKEVEVADNIIATGDNFIIESLEILDLGKIYDDIRCEMLSYERATAFKNIGVTRKQIVAEMFERDGVINLYLALDPELMLEKGYSVSKYTEPEFAIVPCKKIVKNEEDYLEVVKLIEEAMKLNNFIRSERNVPKLESDEQTRKAGFAFYVKNEVVATSAADYYKLLRSMVLSYSLASGRQFPKTLDNKMVLKIFKKDEQVFLYLALDAEKEGLEFVGYDKNFADTPALYEIKVADNVVRANQLIDKLMYRLGMEKHPEKAEFSFDEEVNKNCGFGYRIRH